MSAALEMLGREALFLAILGALGSAPAAWMPGPLPPLARLALAPAFGIALGAAVCLTAAELMPMGTAAWVVVLPLCGLSAVAFALRWGRIAAEGQGARPAHVLLALGAVVVVATGLNAAPIDAGSPGPVAYTVADAGTYAQLSGILEEHTWTDDRLGPPWDRSAVGFRRFLDSDLFQTTGSTPLPAALSAIPGWPAVDSQSAFSITMVLAGALACLAAVLVLSGSIWAALLASLLYGGPLTYQLFVDGSQAVLMGLALVPALGVVAVALLRSPRSQSRERWALAALLGLIIAGLLPAYPLLVPPLAAAVLVGALVALAARWRDRAPLGPALRGGALLLAFAALVAIALSPLAFARSLDYWQAVGAGLLDQPIAAVFGTRDFDAGAVKEILPDYRLPVEVLPGWVLGTREFHGLGPVTASPARFLLAVVVPALLLGLIALGALRWRHAWVFLVPLPIAVASALYSSLGEDCSYCVQRNLLVLGACAPVLIALGLGALARMRLSWGGEGVGAIVAVVAGIGLVVIAGREAGALERRGVYVMPAELRQVAAEAAPRSGSLQLEGFLGLAESNIEQPSLYAYLRQTSDRRLGLLPSAAAIEGRHPFSAAEPYDPRYTEVLTRFASIATPRETIARAGPYALQGRAGGLDVIVVSGLSAEPSVRDLAGRAWVNGPLGFVLSTLQRGSASVRASFTGLSPRGLRVADPARIISRSSHRTVVCLPMAGDSPVRIGTLDITIERRAGAMRVRAQVPFMALRLAALRAAPSGCPSLRTSAGPGGSS